MNQLSDKSAKQYYSILLDIAQWDIDLAIKVPIFKNLLEIEVLNEVTGKNHFEDKYENNKVIETGQKTYLINNKQILDRFGAINKDGVRKDLFTGINDLFAKRNIAEHEKKVNYAVYIGTLNTITESIKYFSKIPIPDKLISILDGKQDPPDPPDPPEVREKLGEKESKRIISKKLTLNLDRDNSVYSSINARHPQWSFTLDNSRFEDDLYIILEDQDDKILYCFYLPKGTINEPRKYFNQRNDEHRTNASIIIIQTNDKNFTNNWPNNENGNNFQFLKYKILGEKYK